MALLTTFSGHFRHYGKVDMHILVVNKPPLVPSTLRALANLPKLIELKLNQKLDRDVIEQARISPLLSPFLVLNKAVSLYRSERFTIHNAGFWRSAMFELTPESC
jgi:hypothetical protein